MSIADVPLTESAPVAVVVVTPSPECARRTQRALEADGLARVAEVVPTLATARRLVLSARADVVVFDPAGIADVGVEIDELMSARPVPIVVLAGAEDSALAVEALALGAVAATHSLRSDDLGTPHADRLRRAVAQASETRPVRRPPIPLGTLPDLPFLKAATRLLAIVGGTGGIGAIEALLGRLPPSIPGAIVQLALPPEQIEALVARLDRVTVLDARVARGGEVITPGVVWFAPGDRQVAVRRHGERSVLDVGPRLSAKPSADALLHSIAATGGRDCVGVVLTGTGVDGAQGLLAMRNAGARTFAESRSSAVADALPGHAAHIGAAEAVCDLKELPWRILESALVTQISA
jgi:two-component system chemotaxis response regulator CheB